MHTEKQAAVLGVISIQITEAFRVKLARANLENNETNKPCYDPSPAGNPLWPLLTDWTCRGIIFQTISHLACCLLAESPWRALVTFLLLWMCPRRWEKGRRSPQRVLQVETKRKAGAKNPVMFNVCLYLRSSPFMLVIIKYCHWPQIVYMPG